MRGIVLLEGADAAGKSTLARHFIEKHGAKYVHSTVRRDIWRWHVGALRLAIRYAMDRLVVLDRHWPSELVYGRAFRDGSAYDVGARCFDRVLRRHGAITVLCVPSDQLAQEQRWVEGRALGKLEHFSTVREVIRLYADLRHGNIAHPGDGYLDQLIRFQDFTERDDVLVYDLDSYRGPRGIAAFATILTQRLERVLTRTIPPRGANLVGRGATIFVGEGPSPTHGTRMPHVPAWPWCDRDDHLSAATWLNRAIHHLALREDRFAFTNAVGDYNYLPAILWSYEPRRVIALGDRALRSVRALGTTAKLVKIEHPQHHRRFHHADGPTGYAKILEEALR